MVYIAPGAPDQLKQYNAVMVDQPEVYISPDSKFQGAKPDQLKVLSDTMRTTLMDRLEAGGYHTTDSPGDDVLYIHWAITDLYLKKKKRGPLSYTPIGFVVHATAQAAIRDLWKKIDVVELSVEAEFLDSVSSDQLAAAVIKHGKRKSKGHKAELVSWEELDAEMKTFGERVRCNLDNAKGKQTEDCASIVIEPEPATK